MKKHHLIFLITTLFVIIFYEQNPGLNIGILGIVVSVLTYFNTEESHKTKAFLALFVMSILSSFAFAWYGDFVSFLAVFTSLFILGFKSKNNDSPANIVKELAKSVNNSGECATDDITLTVIQIK